MLIAFARERVDQCVALAGFSWVVLRTISAATAARRVGFHGSLSQLIAAQLRKPLRPDVGAAQGHVCFLAIRP